MKVVLLSQNHGLYSSKRLVEEGDKRGHEVIPVDFTRAYLTMDAGPEATVNTSDGPLKNVDGVLARIGASSSFFGTAVVRQFEMQDIVCINASLATARSRDKLRALQILCRKGIGIPRTAVAHHPDEVDLLLGSVGKPPYVIKVVEGSKGLGVVKADSLSAARSVVEALHGLEAKILVQEFIAEAGGADVRCFVVGERVVAAMTRQGAPDDFRSNLHRGGSASEAKLSKVERETAVTAAKAMGLAVAGVDMLRSSRGPLIMEVNSSPGLEGIENSTGKNVAEKIFELLEKQAPKGHRGDRAARH